VHDVVANLVTHSREIFHGRAGAEGVFIGFFFLKILKADISGKSGISSPQYFGAGAQNAALRRPDGDSKQWTCLQIKAAILTSGFLGGCEGAFGVGRLRDVDLSSAFRHQLRPSSN